MILFVGLGNPGKKYHESRHNFGFMAVDALVDSQNPTSISKTSFKGELFKLNNTLFLKPMTFMNLSGESVSAVASFYKPSRVIVVHDDLDLPLGSVRFKVGGGDGGHNGLKSIDSHIGKDYERVRLGIGKPSFKSQITSYVLEPFAPQERQCVFKTIDYVHKVLLEFSKKNLDEIKASYTNKRICEDG